MAFEFNTFCVLVNDVLFFFIKPWFVYMYVCVVSRVCVKRSDHAMPARVNNFEQGEKV